MRDLVVVLVAKSSAFATEKRHRNSVLDEPLVTSYNVLLNRPEPNNGAGFL
jgi:hypothetical protein